MTVQRAAGWAELRARVASVDPSEILPAGVAIRNHPTFFPALAHYTKTVFPIMENQVRDGKILCQLSRFSALCFVIYLDETADPGDPRGGATATRLKEILAQAPYATKSWIRSALRAFEHADMVEAIPMEADRRMRRYKPTPRLIEIGRTGLLTIVEALHQLEPFDRTPEEIVGQPKVVEAHAIALIELLMQHGFSTLPHFPHVLEMLSPDYGHLICSKLIGGIRITLEGEYLSDVPFGELSERFGVSRAHIRNVLSYAAEQGKLEHAVRGGHTIRLDPAFAENWLTYAATDLALHRFVIENIVPERLPA
ncbi:hypothetical protein [Pontivivens ytuae]|uniref:Uncharacterized protein n=1 Tax=Pontivivens ytuae TaxID=2789856 RepID=A0A7S9QCE9_9RHOB|nr:hypothetical protein [Pontivivens ytuae]QPH53317.1 hypothetical protein I0K15_16220 [Pontivivens ytuae]